MSNSDWQDRERLQAARWRQRRGWVDMVFVVMAAVLIAVLVALAWRDVAFGQAAGGTVLWKEECPWRAEVSVREIEGPARYIEAAAVANDGVKLPE